MRIACELEWTLCDGIRAKVWELAHAVASHARVDEPRIPEHLAHRGRGR